MLELIQYFVRCCGCQAEVSITDFRNEDATDIIRTITENFDEVHVLFLFILFYLFIYLLFRKALITHW